MEAGAGAQRTGWTVGHQFGMFISIGVPAMVSDSQFRAAGGFFFTQSTVTLNQFTLRDARYLLISGYEKS